MSNLRTFAIHAILLVIIGSVTTSARMLFKEHYAWDSRVAGERAWVRGARNKERKWRQLSYASAHDRAFVDSFLAQIQWEKLALQGEQASKLRARVAEIIDYLTDPSFEKYYLIKTHGLHFEFKPTAAALFLATNNYAALTPIQVAPETKQLLMRAWNTAHVKSGHVAPPRIVAVCLTQVSGAISHTNTVWSLLTGTVAKGFTRAAEAVDPGFLYSQTSQSAAKPDDNTFFHLSFYAQSDEPESAGPIYISLSWLPKDRDWALTRLVSDYWLNMHTLL